MVFPHSSYKQIEIKNQYQIQWQQKEGHRGKFDKRYARLVYLELQNTVERN